MTTPHLLVIPQDTPSKQEQLQYKMAATVYEHKQDDYNKQDGYNMQQYKVSFS